MTLAQEMTLLGQKAKEAARLLAKASPAAKNAALTRLAALLEEREAELRTANAQDLDAARARGLDAPRMDRLTLHPAVLADMRAACLHVAGLPDPVGAMDSQWQRPNGLLVGRMRVPLGVIAMIYEARPNVTIDAAILCLKAGNAVILRGGSEALHSNTALAALLRQALEEAGLPADAAQLVTTTDHAAVTELCKLDQYIDVMIPRGGEGLVRAVTEAATMPVLKHYKGVCHAFVDADADLDKALDIVFNGKVILGTRARKTCSKSFQAFSSVNYPDLAVVQDEHLLQYMRCACYPKPVFYDTLDANVGLLKLIPGTPAAVLGFMLERYDGLVIESFGVGGLPEYEGDDSYFDIISRGVERGKIVVMTTQVPNEGSDLTVYHVGGHLKQTLRLLEAYDMTTEAAVAKLMWIMGQTHDFAEAEKLFYAPVARDILYSNE